MRPYASTRLRAGVRSQAHKRLALFCNLLLTPTREHLSISPAYTSALSVMLQRSRALLASVMRATSAPRSATPLMFNYSRNNSKNQHNNTLAMHYNATTLQCNHSATVANLPQRRLFSTSPAVHAKMTPISELSPEEADRVRQVLPDHAQLVAAIEANLPTMSDAEFNALVDTTRENKMTHSKLPSVEDARLLIFGYLKRNELDAAWVTYLDLKSTLKTQQQAVCADKTLYDALLIYYGLHQKFNYADTIYQDLKKAQLFEASNMHRVFVPDQTTLHALLLAYQESGLLPPCLEVFAQLYAHHCLPTRAQLCAVLKCAALAGEAKTFVRFYSRLDHKGTRLSRASLRHVLSEQVWSKKVNASSIEERVHRLSPHDEKYWGVLTRLAVRAHNWQLVSDCIALVDKFAAPPTPAVTVLEAPLRQLLTELAWVPAAATLRDRARALADRLARLHARVNARALATDVRNFYADLPAELTKLGYNPRHVVVTAEQRQIVKPERVRRVTRRESMAQYLPEAELQRRHVRGRYESPFMNESTLFQFAPQYSARQLRDERVRQQRAEQLHLQQLHREVTEQLPK